MKKMKKVLAGLLTATMITSMSMTAFADDMLASSTDNKVKIYKTYKSYGDTAVSPAEKIEFSVEFKSVEKEGVEYNETTQEKPTVDILDLAEGDAKITNNKYPITVNLPSYNAVGIYTYEITEIGNDLAGVTYLPTPITLVVTVIQDSDKYVVAAVHCENPAEPSYNENSTKTDEFINTYAAGQLTVGKTVAGNMGDQSADNKFTITVTFTSDNEVGANITYSDDRIAIAKDKWNKNDGVYTATVDIELAHGNTLVFENIPNGVRYEVVEKEPGVYTDTYTSESGKENESGKGTITATKDAQDVDTVTVTNTYTSDVDTGIILDSAPYVLLLALAAMGVFAVVNKKREEEF